MGFPGEASIGSNRCGGGSGSIVGGKKQMSPRAITMLMSHLLYRRRSAPYYVEPVVVGLETVRVPLVVQQREKNGGEGGDGDVDRVLQREGMTPDEENANNNQQQLDSVLQLLATRQSQIQTQTNYPPPILQQQSSPSQTKSNPTPTATTTNTSTTKTTTYQRPYLCTTDMLGAQSTSHSFVCSGMASRSLHGTAEALWKPNLEAEELVEVCGRAFVSALERDCLSGYGAVVYLIRGKDNGVGGREEEGDVEILEYVLACRND